MLMDLAVAFARGDLTPQIGTLAHDVVLDVVGDRRLEGVEAVGKFVEQTRVANIKELHIHHIITHGPTAALNASLMTEDDMRHEYCDVYVFASAGKQAKLKEITSYRI